MKRVVQLVLLAIATVGVLFVVAGLVLSRQWHVRHSVVIVATPEQIHPFVEDLHRWETWATWRKPDPSLRFEYTGPRAGAGATRSYHGERAGVGKTTITRSDPLAGVWFESTMNADAPNASGSISYRPSASATEVTWEDTGTLPPIIGGYLRDSIEQGLLRHFEHALGQLKQTVEHSVREEQRSAPPPTAPQGTPSQDAPGQSAPGP